MTTDKNAAELARENEELRANAARLKADVEYWKETHDGQIGFTNLVIEERDALQFELTKARELLPEMRRQFERANFVKLGKLINEALARQSAPAEKADNDVRATGASVPGRVRAAIIADQSQEGVDIAKGRFGMNLAVLCRQLDGEEERMRPKSAPVVDVRAVVAECTPQDRAIEHAGYLATAADSVQEAYQAYSLAQMNVDEGGDDGEGELAELVDSARDDLHEALHDLRGMAYEFRKRRDRSISQ